MHAFVKIILLGIAAGILAGGADASDEKSIMVGGEGANCLEDPHCVNRLHPEIETPVRARPGQKITFNARNASDFVIDPSDNTPDPRKQGPRAATVHPLTGPVYIEGAKRGDALAVTIDHIVPGAFGFTQIGPIGFLADIFTEPISVVWRLNEEYAVSDDLPGVRIPNASFPGVVSVLPGADAHEAMLARERELAQRGGLVFAPEPAYASPATLCGMEGSHRDACLRTIPPREHGGNMDIRHMGEGATIHLPCRVDGCGLMIGDPHFAQGDGEVSGSAIEMDAAVTVTTRVVKDGARRISSPQYEGPSRLLDIPSRRFYATVGLPLKEKGETPPDMDYLASPHAAELENLSKDISLAARNALRAMIAHISTRYGLTPAQAYIVASVSVDMRIGQLVDAPNVSAMAVLPTDIFVDHDGARSAAVTDRPLE